MSVIGKYLPIAETEITKLYWCKLKITFET